MSGIWLVLFSGCRPPPPTGEEDLPQDTSTLETTDSATFDTGTVARDCTVRFAWFQKDALSEDDGLNHEPWPTHTTTALEWYCPGTDFNYLSLNNHGTGYTDLTETGEFALDMEDWTEDVPLSENELEALTAAYTTCTCEDETAVQSLDSLTDAGVSELLSGVADRVRAELVCAQGTSVEQLADWIAAGEIDLALDTYEACHFDGGTTWSDLFDSAFEAAGGELAATHVSNNDAALQATWFLDWQESREPGDCTAWSALCSAPLWFYDR